jgi:membrane fusion protein (multidrug efflux system)
MQSTSFAALRHHPLMGLVLCCSLLLSTSVALSEAAHLVKLAPIVTAPIRYHVSTFGVLAPSIEDLSFQIPGRIDRFLVDEGDLVIQGQILAQLQTTDALDQLSKQKVALDQAQRKLARIDKLHQEGSVQKSQLEDVQDDYEKTRIAHEQAELNLRRCYLRAPAGGVILKEFLDSRTTIAPGMPIFAFQSKDEAWVAEVDLTDRHTFNLQVGSQAVLRFAPYAGEEFLGTVSKLAGIANDSNGLFTAEITFATRDRVLKPGMIAEVNLYQASADNYTTVPLDALVGLRSNRARIYVVAKGTSSVVEKTVVVKSVIDAEAALQDSLDDYEMVVVRGQSGLESGSVIVSLQAQAN